MKYFVFSRVRRCAHLKIVELYSTFDCALGLFAVARAEYHGRNVAKMNAIGRITTCFVELVFQLDNHTFACLPDSPKLFKTLISHRGGYCGLLMSRVLLQ